MWCLFEVKVWFIFYIGHCISIFNIMLYWIMLYKHQAVICIVNRFGNNNIFHSKWLIMKLLQIEKLYITNNYEMNTLPQFEDKSLTWNREEKLWKSGCNVLIVIQQNINSRSYGFGKPNRPHLFNSWGLFQKYGNLYIQSFREKNNTYVC